MQDENVPLDDVVRAAEFYALFPGLFKPA